MIYLQVNINNIIYFACLNDLDLIYCVNDVVVIWLRDNEVICYKLVYFNLNRKENKSVYLKFNMKNYAKSLIQIYSAFYYAKYFFVFSIKAVWIYVTYYMKYTLGYGIFKRKQWKGRLILNYQGELIDKVVAVGLEKQYKVKGKESYVFFFM